MAESSLIEWTDATWQIVTGCSIVSPGCAHCYAMKLAGTRLRNHPSRAGLTTETKNGPVWTGEVRFNEQWLLQPLQWKRPRMIFVAAHGDLFHEDVPDEVLDQIFAVMALAPQHTYQVLTKRTARMRRYFAGIVGGDNGERIEGPEFRDALIEGAAQAIYARLHLGEDPSMWLSVHMPLSQVWLGASVERQQEAVERIPDLLATPAAVRFISAEPLLSALDLTDLCNGHYFFDALRGERWHDDPDGPNPRQKYAPGLDWIIVGGESGARARPMHPDWARSLRDQCAAAGVPFFFKQWGGWYPWIDRDGEDPDWRKPYGRFQEPAYQILNLAGGRGFHGERVHVMRACSKKAAGRLLDGVAHNGMPEPRA